MADFKFAYQAFLDAEGGYADHPDDPGGRTWRGASEAWLQRHGHRGDPRDADPEDVERWMREDFWDGLRLGELDSRYVAAEMFDTAALAGPDTAARVAQRVCNLLGERVAVDGAVGPQTLGALNRLCRRYEKHVYHALNGEQYDYIKGLYEADPARRRAFIRGWMLRLARFPEMLP